MNKKNYFIITGLILALIGFIVMYLLELFFPIISDNNAIRWIVYTIVFSVSSTIIFRFFNKGIYRNNPELAKMAKINENDERYILIRKTAAYYMWFITLVMLCVVFLLLIIQHKYDIAWLIGAVIMVHICLYVVLLLKLNKE